VTRADFVLAVVAAPVVSPLPLPSALPTGSPSLAVYHARPEGANPPALSPDQLLFAKDVHVHVVDDAATISATRTAVDAARALVQPRPDAPYTPCIATRTAHVASSTGAP
jgi:hypothetical protein